jgi:phosphomannomutase
MGSLDAETQASLKAWQSKPFDKATRAAVADLTKQGNAAILDHFSGRLTFGTAGMRGLMGVGPNRLNRYTIALATEGLARYLSANTPQGITPRVIIGYDSRHHSAEFAEVTARVLAAHGFDVRLFAQMRPTPWVSFGVRYLRCQAGVMITASHNPSEYNGYKVYWSDGAQVLPPHDTGIMAQIESIQDPWRIPMADLDDPAISVVRDELDDDYLAAIAPLQNFPEQNKRFGAQLRVVYSSLHGTGITVIDKVLASWGFSQLIYVTSQIIPDGDFPTAPYPNPEKPEAMRSGSELLEKDHGDVLIVNDPDADRIGIGCLHHGKTRLFSGNECAVLCLYYLANAWKSSRPSAKKLGAIKTIVTTEAFRAVAERFGIACSDVLTGFKYIGQLIGQWEAARSPTYLFGGEESYGCLYGTHCRDKDGIGMAALVCEIALHLKQEGMTLAEYFDQIEREVGIYRNAVLSVEFPATEAGIAQMRLAMEKLRGSLSRQLGDREVLSVADYTTGKVRDLKTGEEQTLYLPHADVLQLTLGDRASVVVRPSGTEPKVKIYASVALDAQEDLERSRADAEFQAVALAQAAEELLRPPAGR